MKKSLIFKLIQQNNVRGLADLLQKSFNLNDEMLLNDFNQTPLYVAALKKGKNITVIVIFITLYDLSLKNKINNVFRLKLSH